MTNTIAADQLKSLVERAERLESERKDIIETEKELFQQAKGEGFDVKAMKAIIAMRKKTRDALAEEEAILDLYKSALGM